MLLFYLIKAIGYRSEIDPSTDPLFLDYDVIHYHHPDSQPDTNDHDTMGLKFFSK